MTLLAVTDSNIIAICSAGAVAISVAALFNSLLKDREREREKVRELAETDHDTDKGEVAALRAVLDRFILTIVGRPADPILGLPKVDGFVDVQIAHNAKVDKKLLEVADELTTSNGGGTLKGSLRLARADIAALSAEVAKLPKADAT